MLSVGFNGLQVAMKEKQNKKLIRALKQTFQFSNVVYTRVDYN